MTGRTASPTPLGGGITSVESGILESFPDPVVVVSRARVVVAANRAAREIVGLGYHGRDLALSLRHPEVLDAVDRVRDSGQPATVEVSFPGAVPRDFNLQVAAIPSGETSPGADIVLVFHDITTAKRSENMRADFVANVSHELRSPLSALLGFIETMRGPARDDGAARERFLDIMQNEARRMTRLIDDLLSLSRVEMNEHVAPTGEVDLASVLRVVVDTAAASSAEARSRLRIDVPGGLPNCAKCSKTWSTTPSSTRGRARRCGSVSPRWRAFPTRDDGGWRSPSSIRAKEYRPRTCRASPSASIGSTRGDRAASAAPASVSRSSSTSSATIAGIWRSNPPRASVRPSR
jgi:signal transduction histidine kinase